LKTNLKTKQKTVKKLYYIIHRW